MANRPGHVYELSHIGFESQSQHAIDIFSQWTDSPIYMIDGNHDRWYIKAVGANIVERVCRALPNAEFLGHDEGDLTIGAAKIKLWHGEDGSSYAISYRIQKVVESLTGGEKPHILICGHTHKAMYVFDRHIHCLSAGAIQSQSKWMRSKRHASHTGFWHADVGIGKTGVTYFSPTWYPAYV
jgi:predicted phosphodiesterase